MFIGRKRELGHLNQRYENGKFEFAVIYRHRRVGKTTLINEFVKDEENANTMGNVRLVTFDGMMHAR